MTRKNSSILLLAVILIGSIFISSCSRRPKGVLNQKEMENLMVDLHVLEGSLRASGYSYHNEDEKNIYYRTLLDKYGISQVEFDSCLSWYTRHPKQFERIYANVISRIEALRTDVEKGKYYAVDSTALSGLANLWTLPTKYVFTKDSARNPLHFEVVDDNLLANDRYELSFLHRLAPSDSSYNPHAVFYVNYLNGIVDSIYTRTTNDSVLRKYTLLFKARKDLKIKSLSGYILGNDSVLGSMSAFVDSIKLIRRFNPFRQDSIRAVVLKADSTRSDSVLALPDSIAPQPKVLPEHLKQVERNMRKIKMQTR